MFKGNNKKVLACAKAFLLVDQAGLEPAKVQGELIARIFSPPPLPIRLLAHSWYEKAYLSGRVGVAKTSTPIGGGGTHSPRQLRF